jgi:anti-sigma factor RsiW
MTHPEDLLADYVDGTLPDRERAAVDAHLATCPVCREEVELARVAIGALATLEEEAVPLGVRGPVLAEAGRRFEGRRATAWRRVQWAVGGAAAAALVLMVALNANLGSSDDGKRATAGSAAAEDAGGAGSAVQIAAPEAAVQLERQADVNYDVAGVRSLAQTAAKRQGQEEPAPFASPDVALDCLRASGAPVDEATTYQLVRLIEAKFEGAPAYFAVFLQSPGAGQPPDHAVVWVTAKNDCGRILDTASLSI